MPGEELEKHEHTDDSADESDWIDQALEQQQNSNTMPHLVLDYLYPVDKERNAQLHRTRTPKQDKETMLANFNRINIDNKRKANLFTDFTYSFFDWEVLLPPRKENVWIHRTKRTLWRRQEERLVRHLHAVDHITPADRRTSLNFEQLSGYWYSDVAKHEAKHPGVPQVYPRNYGVVNPRTVITTPKGETPERYRTFMTWFNNLRPRSERRLVKVTNYRYRSFIHAVMVCSRGIYGYPNNPDFSSIFGTIRALQLTDNTPPPIYQGAEVRLAVYWGIPSVLFLPMDTSPGELRALITTPYALPNGTEPETYRVNYEQVWLTLSETGKAVPEEEGACRNAMTAWCNRIYELLRLPPPQLHLLTQKEVLQALLENPYFLCMVQIEGTFYPLAFNDPIGAVQRVGVRGKPHFDLSYMTPDPNYHTAPPSLPQNRDTPIPVQVQGIVLTEPLRVHAPAPAPAPAAPGEAAGSLAACPVPLAAPVPSEGSPRNPELREPLRVPYDPSNPINPRGSQPYDPTSPRSPTPPPPPV